MAKVKTKRRTDPEGALIAAAMTLAARDGWRRLTMAAIAAEAGMAPTEAMAVFASTSHLLAGLGSRFDDAVLAELAVVDDTGDEGVKDRLFDILMRRFDAMAPYRAGLAAVVRDLPGTPLAALRQLCRLEQSMARMLTAAAVPATGPLGALRVKGLTLVYANALRVWFDDDSADAAKTMAALDRGLELADRAATACAGMPRPSRTAAEA